jgi:hypothetical protein
MEFGKSKQNYFIVDSSGSVQPIELITRTEGRFLSDETTAPPGERMLAQAKRTIHRRNLFHISGTVKTPREPLLIITEPGERVPIDSLEVTVSATEQSRAALSCLSSPQSLLRLAHAKSTSLDLFLFRRLT